MRVTKPTTISLPKDLLRKLEAQAKKESLTRSELLRKAFQLYLEDRSWTALYRFGEKQARKLRVRESDVETFVDELRK